MEAKLDYVSVGVNRVVNALAWGEHGGVAYAAHHMVALYDVKSAKVVSTLCGHTGMVNCVLWVPHEATPDLPPHQHLLLSGAADNTIRCWLVTYPSSHPQPSSPPSAPSWRCLAVLSGHTAPVTSLAMHRLPPLSTSSPSAPSPLTPSLNTPTPESAPPGPALLTPSPPPGELLLVSTAGDDHVLVWGCGGGSSGQLQERGAGAVEGQAAPAPPRHAAAPGVPPPVAAPAAGGKGGRCGAGGVHEDGDGGAVAEAVYGSVSWWLHQRLHVGTRLQDCVALSGLPLDPEWTLLATGGTDRRITLHLRPPGPGAVFSPACVLEGHENWVRGVAFCTVVPEDAGALPQLLLASVSQDRYGRVWKLQPEPLEATATNTTTASQPPQTTVLTTGVQQNTVPSTMASAAVGGDVQLVSNPGVGGELAALIQRYAPRPQFATTHTRYLASCEALLIGHEDWVHGLQWAPPPPPPSPPGAASGGGGCGVHTRRSAALLTASMDRTMIIWRYEAGSGLWMNEASLGDAGATCLGYFGGVWGPGGAGILAHGFTGALHLWLPPSPSPSEPPTWLPHHALGGHFGPVADLSWGLDGGCVISVGEDQTARVHAGVRGGPGAAGGGEGGGEGKEEEEEHWCEIARSQIHGHDFRCVAAVPTAPPADFMYVSGSEEKVLRVLEAPQAFIDSLIALRGGPHHPVGQSLAAQRRRGHAFGAALAALGLSNKAVGAAEGAGGNAGVGSGMPGGEYTEGPDFVPCAAPQVVREPPLEEHLAQNTLWPETHKLYGHGNDVFCIAASPDGRLLASACKAQTASTASIWVWCTSSWRPLAQLKAHTLTVTQLEWAPHSQLLAAASRDRTFSVFRKITTTTPPPAATAGTPQQQQQESAAANGGGANGNVGGGASSSDVCFELVYRAKGAHGRVIWGVSWSTDERLIATASRDDTVKVWWSGFGGDVSTTAQGTAGDGFVLPSGPKLALTLPQFHCAATAVAFAPLSLPPGVTSSGVVVSVGADSVGVEEGANGGVGTVSGCRQLLAVGLEDGGVQLWELIGPVADGNGLGAGVVGGGGVMEARCVWVAGPALKHAAAVRRLRWRGAPGTGCVQGGEGRGGGWMQLASGSEDHSVRVYSFRTGGVA